MVTDHIIHQRDSDNFRYLNHQRNLSSKFYTTIKTTNAHQSSKSVCVIGAGAAGLCALRHFITRPDCFGPIVCYEQTSQIGGTWNYSEDVGLDQNGLAIHSSMYRDLQ